MVSAILSLSPILKDRAMLHVRQGVIAKAPDFALSMVLFSAEGQEEDYVKIMARWGMGSGIPHDLYFFYFFSCLALSKGERMGECGKSDKGIFAVWNFTHLYSVVTPKRYK